MPTNKLSILNCLTGGLLRQKKCPIIKVHNLPFDPLLDKEGKKGWLIYLQNQRMPLNRTKLLPRSKNSFWKDVSLRKIALTGV